jgi:glycosyltransferase involved in cell wall biosynthesis
VIIPCRNEVLYIGACLDCIIRQTYPQDRMEVLVIDGMSDDGTRKVLSEYKRNHANIRVLDNLKRGIPQGLNIGVRHAKGDRIIRADAHCAYPVDYVSRLIYWQNQLNADNVGAVLYTAAGAYTRVAVAIAYVMSVPFGVGGSLFRTGVLRPMEVDTVPFGCFRREVFDRIGLFDESMPRTEDDEFNARLREGGGRIFLVPDVQIKYYARDTVYKFLRMLFQYGFFKPQVAIKRRCPTSVRQLVPPCFVLVCLGLVLGSVFYWPLVYILACGIAAHLMAGAGASLKIAKAKGVLCALLSIGLFLLMHFAYGTGYLLGLVATAVFGVRVADGGRDVPLSR